MRQKTLTNSQLLDAIRNRANKFQLTEHFATAQNYLSTARSFSQYILMRDSAHAQFNAATVQDYYRYLQTERRVLRNTQSFYLRFLRATYCAMGGCADVFKDAYTSVEPTRKRALPAHVGLAKSGLTTLSSYTARHTWATQAYHAGIPVSVISEGMGHSTEKVTRIYLAQLTPTIIDRYNHTLLHSIGFR